jgi:hypothetical protein
MDKLSEYLIPKSELSPEARATGGTDVRGYLSPVGIKELRPDVDVRDYEKFFEQGQVPISSPFLDDLRARRQSKTDKWANGIVRGVVTAGTTAVEPFVDLLVGAPTALFTGDASKVYDNSLSRLLDSINEAAQEAMPIFKDQQYQDAGFLGKISKANFWAEDFTQGVGFMAGAVLSTVMGAGLLNAAKVPGMAQSAYSMTSKAFRGKNVGTAAGMLDDIAAAGLARAGGENLSKQVLSKAVGLMAAAGESGIEARGAKDSVRAALMARTDLNLTEEEIEDIASTAGNASFAINMALVGGSNIIQFNSIARDLMGIGDVAKAATRMTGKGLLAKTVAATTSAGKKLVYGKAALMNPLTETFQEGGQFVTEKFLEDMMGTRYDPEGANNINDYIDGFTRSLEETFGSTEGQTSMFLGALLGAIGMPGMGGGIYGDIKEANQRFAKEQAAADAVNKSHLGKKFAGLHRSATYSANYARRKEEALESGDPFVLIDAEMDNFKVYLMELAEAGRLDIAQEHLQGIMDLAQAAREGDTTALDQFTEATGLQAVPEDLDAFVEMFKKGIARAETINKKVAPYSALNPDLGRLVGDLMFSEGNYDQMIEDAQKTLNDIASRTNQSFDFKAILKGENPSQELNALVSQYIRTNKIDPEDRKAMNAAKGILLGAAGRKELIREAYDYLAAQEKENYKELVESMAAKREMFNRQATNKQTKRNLVDGMDWTNEEDRQLFDQGTMVEDGEFISGEFEMVVPKAKRTPPEEFPDHFSKKEIEEALKEWHDKYDALNEETERVTGRFMPNGDIRATDSTGKSRIYTRGPVNYAMIDQATMKRPQEIKAKNETTKIRGIVTQLGKIIKTKLSDNALTADNLKEELDTIEETLKAMRSKTFDKGTTAKMVKQVQKTIKALEAAMIEIDEQLTALAAEQRSLESERAILLEEYKYLQENNMTVAEYTKRRDDMKSSQEAIAQHIEEKSGVLAFLRSVLEKLQNLFARLTKPLESREGSVVSETAVVVEDLTAPEYELAEDAGQLVSSYAVQKDINNLINEIELLRREADVLDKTVPILDEIIKKYNQRVAAEKRAARQAALAKVAGKEQNPLAPTTEIQDQEDLYAEGTEPPKGTVHEVFRSTTGNFKEHTPQSDAWFKFTETLTPEEMKSMRLVPVISEANQFAELFATHGIEFVEQEDGKDIKLVVVDAEGNPVMRFGFPMVTSMPLPRGTFLDGSTRYRKTDPSVANQVIAGYAAERNLIIENLKQGKTDLKFEMTGKRRGIPILDPRFVENSRPETLAEMAENPHKSVVGVLAPTEEAAEKMPVSVAVSVQPGKNQAVVGESGAVATMRAGAVFADTGAALVPLIKRRITQEEAKSLFNAIRLMVKQRAEYMAAKKAKSPTEAKLKQTYMFFPGTSINIKSYLENILAWGNLNAEFPEYNIYFTSSTTSAGELMIGGTAYDVQELMEENSPAGEAVVEFLLRKFHHVNAKTLKSKQKFSTVQVADDLTVTTQEFPSYKSYLTLPNGREQKNVPLGTWLVDQVAEDPSVHQYGSVNLTYDTQLIPPTTPGEVDPEAAFLATESPISSFGESAATTGVQTEAELDELAAIIASAEQAELTRDAQDNQAPKVQAAVDPDQALMDAIFAAAEASVANVDTAAPATPKETPKNVVPDEFGAFTEDDLDVPPWEEDGLNREDAEAATVLASELAEELSWFYKAFGSREKVIIAEMANAGVLGKVTRAGQVLLNRVTAPGTVYHEAFHLVTNFYMTASQQKELWNDWRERTGNKTATDLQAEEALAEEFRLFAQSGGTVMPKYKSRNIFQKLYDFLKKFVTRSKSIENIFQDLYSGKYATVGKTSRTLSVALNRMSPKDLRDQMDIKDENSSQLLEILDAFTIQLMKEVHKLSQVTDVSPMDILAGKPILDKEGKPMKSEKGKVRRYSNQVYLTTFNVLVDNYNKLRATPNLPEKAAAQMDAFAATIKNRAAFMEFHANYMRDSQLAFRFDRNTKQTVLDQDTGDSIDDMVQEQEVGGRLTWDWIDSVQIDPTSQATPELKVLFVGLRKTYAGKPMSSSTMGLPKMAPVKDILSYLQVELAGSRNFPDMIEKVRALIPARPELAELLDRMRIPQSGPITPVTLSPGHKKMQDAFFRQFAKTKYDFQLLLKNREGNLVMFDSNRQRNEDRILSAWEAAQPGGLARFPNFVKIVNGRREFNPDYKFKLGPGREFSLKDMTKNEVAKALTYADRINILSAFGISFEKVISNDVLRAAFPSIVTYVTTNPSLNTFFRNNKKGKLSISQDLRKLAEEALAVSSSRIDLQHQTADGKTIYGVGEYNYLMNTIDQLRAGILPAQWDPEQNLTAKGSHWLATEARTELQVALLSGFRNDQSKEGTEPSKMDTATLMTTYFHAVNNGIMPLPRTAEKNLVYGMRVPKELRIESLSQTVDILQNHLRAELETMLELDQRGTGKETQYYNQRAKELRMFYGITVSPADLMSMEDVNFFVTEARADLEAYMLSEVAATRELLGSYGLFEAVNEGRSIKTVLKSAEKNTTTNTNMMSIEDFDLMVSQFVFNTTIANLEAVKLFYGDMAYFKSSAEFFKRTPGAVGTKLLPRLDAENLAWLDDNSPRMDEKTRDGGFTAVTFDDVKVSTDIQELRDLHPGKYENMDEADAQGWMSLDGYRDFHMLNNSWIEAQEKAFQKVAAGTPLTTTEVGLFGPIKPMYFGPQAGVGIMPTTYYKTSLMPLLPDFFRHQESKSKLEQLYNQMVANQLDIVLMNTGNKMGRKMPMNEDGTATTLPFYTEDGNINTIPQDAISNLSWEYLGEQVKVDPGVDTQVNFGTQVRKLIWSTMFEGGRPKSITVDGKKMSPKEVQEMYNEYGSIIESMLNEDEQKLMEEMGLSRNKAGEYVFEKDPELVMKMIEKEMRRMDYAENSIDGMRTMFASEIKKVDVLPNKREVEQLLMSISKNRVMRQQMPGSMRVLVASTGFESGRTSIQGSNDLKFYQPSQDGTNRAQIKIPLPKEWAKAIYGMTSTPTTQNIGVALQAFNKMIAEGKVDEKILYRTAYRIPNHGLPATDALIVKEFLHPAAGNIVMLPSEIVSKAGSDYDIDKLSVFDRNLEITDEGIAYISEGRKGQENRLMEIMEGIILAPENYKALTQPTETKRLQDLAKVVREAKKTPAAPQSGLGMLSFKNVVRVAKSFWSGKDGVGITAVNLTSHTIAQASNLKYLSEVPLIFATAPENEMTGDNMTLIDLSRDADTNGVPIIDTLGMFLNAYVDVAKDDFVIDINAGPAFSGVYMFLIRAGVPIDTIVYFMNQPGVSQVLMRMDSQQSEIFAGDKGPDNKPVNKSTAQIFEEVIAMYPAGQNISKPLTNAQLIQGMEGKGDSKGQIDAVQRKVLHALETYMTAASDLRALTQATNFDTSFGKTWRSPLLRETKLAKILTEGNFVNVGDYIASPILSGFRTKAKNSSEYFQSLFLSAAGNMKKYIDPIIEILSDNMSVAGVNAAATERALKALEDGLTTFLLESVRANDKVLIDRAEELLFGAQSLPLRIEAAKQKPGLKGNYLLDKITGMIAPIREGKLLKPDSIQLFSNKLNSYETAALVDGFVELMALDSSLAQDLADFLIIQSGVGFSPKSGIRIIPAGLYMDRSIAVLSTIEGQNVDTLMKDFQLQFFQNNVHLKGVAPKLSYNHDSPNQFTHKFKVGRTIPEFVADTFSHLEDLGELTKEGEPKKTKMYHTALYKRVGIDQKGDKIQATYKRVGEKGVANSFQEYYPSNRASILPINNPGFRTADGRSTVKVPDPKLSPVVSRLPAGNTSGTTNLSKLFEALQGKLTVKQFDWVMKNHGISHMTKTIAEYGANFEENISDIVDRYKELADLNCPTP